MAIGLESPQDAPAQSETKNRLRIVLFDSHGEDRLLQGLSDLEGLVPAESQLLWIDLLGSEEDSIDRIAELCSLPKDVANALKQADAAPKLINSGKFFALQVVAITHHDAVRFQGSALTIAAGANMVISAHADQIDFIDQITMREGGETALGSLSSASFTASLLDWHLSTYFDAVAHFELAVERLEVAVLSERPRDCLDDLRDLRKGASRLRRMLAPHRVVFSGLSRPDFRPQDGQLIDQHFLTVDGRFERAMDMVENTRDLVVGSFELFSTRAVLATNDQMRVLTFVTVLIGVLAFIAGVLGMNFDAPFFHTGVTGFWASVVAMIVLTGIAIVIGKWKKWM